MGMFSGVGTFVKGKLHERDEAKEKEREYQRVLGEEEHKARMENIPKVAKMRANDELKAIKVGKPHKSGGVLGGIQNYANNFGDTAYGKGGGGFGGFEMPQMDFGFGAAPKKRTSKKSHKKSKRR